MSEIILQQILEGERALFMKSGLQIRNSTFQNGESPLKHCSDIDIEDTFFRWKYPMWYSRNLTLRNCVMFEMARAGIWYTRNISMTDCDIQAPKSFRRSSAIELNNVVFSNAAETLWHCDGVRMDTVVARGDYFAMNSRDMKISNLRLDGNYAFDGASNLEISDSRLLCKDAFWNAENVVVRNSYILGEYLGWNSRNVTFVDCVIESLQGMCYMTDLRLENCKLINTTLAFEYSTVKADINGPVDSIKNPVGGEISADAVGEIIFDDPAVDPADCSIRIWQDHEKDQ